MRFVRDRDDAIDLAVDLVNSWDAAEAAELLRTPEDLRALLDVHEISGVERVSDDDLRRVRGLRDRLRAIFATDDVDAAVAAVNALVADAEALPQLVAHDGQPLHLHFTSPQATLVHKLAAEVGMGLAVVIRDHGLARLRTCAAPGCEDVYVDTSRNRSRRYCDDTCGNRLHVAAYRERRKTEAS